ncbi:Lactonase, 7-bladed beta-propeller [compost metagenome]
MHPRQLAGAIHVHPSGKFVYLVNRADATHSHQGHPVFSGGENNIAVYAITPETGEPTLVQHVDTRSFHVRTFACDPSGRLLVTASIKALAAYYDEKGLTVTPATLSIFRIADDGHLKYVRSVDVETQGNQLQYWMGIVGLR